MQTSTETKTSCAPTLAGAVGTFLKTYRSENSITLDAVAQAARRHGSTMSASSIQSIEKGDFAGSLGTLITLVLSLNTLTEKDLSLVDLFTSVPAVRLTEKSTEEIPAQWVTTLFNQTPVVREPAPTGERECPSLKRPGSLCEIRTARKLKITINELRECALTLWDQSLEEEIQQQAGTETTPQKRGQITRVLMREIIEHLDAKNTRSKQ